MTVCSALIGDAIIYVYSLAVSVKMNILLFAPGWLIIFIMSHGIYSSILHITVYCGLPQVRRIALINSL